MRALVFIVSLAFAAVSVAAESKAAVEAELERITNEMLAAIAPGDVAVWKKYAHERLIYSTEANEVLTKAKLIEQLAPLPKGLTGHLEVGDFQVELHGNTAIATYVANERLDYHGQAIKSQFRTTDTWLKTNDGWQLIATQVLAVLVDPPAIALPRETLCGYNGTYRLTNEIATTVTCTEGGLESVRTGRKPVVQKPEVRDVFFTLGQPRTRRVFLRNDRGEVTGFADRREGHDVVWTKIVE